MRLLSVLTTLVVRDDRVSPFVDVVQTALDNVRLGVRGGSSGGMSLMSLSLSDNIRRRLSGVSLSETATVQTELKHRFSSNKCIAGFVPSTPCTKDWTSLRLSAPTVL